MKKRSKSFKKPLLVGSSLMMAAMLVSAGSATAFAKSGDYTVDKTYDKYVEEAQALNVEVMQEGMVLLKNKLDALPISKNTKVSVLGSGSYKSFLGEISKNATSVYVPDALKDYFDVNPALSSVYANITSKKIGGVDFLLQPDKSAVESALTGYTDVAIITLSRFSKEANDLEKTAAGMTENEVTAAHELALSSEEKELIELAKSKCGKVIVLLNTSTVVQIPELEADDGVDAVLYVGLPGLNGFKALGSVLTGEVSPSGRTVDTWYSDFTKDPTYKNATTDVSALDENTRMVEYEEGIYLGYKYYETAYAEAQAGHYDGFDYDEAVVYPFGYGLSYTTFTQELLTTSVDLSGKSFDDYIDVQVKVTNTGDVAGKEVVQIYNHAPYTSGEIEKSEVVLVGFGKTGTLAANGGYETVTVKVRVGDLASFDYNDANENNWYGYEIEAGNYELRLQSNSHNIINNQKIAFNVASDIKFTNDGKLTTATNTQKDTVFSNGDDFDTLKLASAENGGDFKVMSRSDFAGTFPTTPDYIFAVGDKYDASKNSRKDGAPTKYSSEFTPDMDDPSDPWYVEEVPSDWTQGADTNYTLYDMAGIDPDSDAVITDGVWKDKTGKQAWTAFLNQLTWDELKAVINSGNFGTPSLASINKAAEIAVNGPEQLGDNGTSWACANILAGTFNEDLNERRGVAMGNEALFNNCSGWYGTTANLNRTPFGGRNHSYYSEDALLTGKITASVIRGVQSRGVIAYVKHFALNEQETGRTGLATFLTEQALRETYLKAFEFAVKEGETLGMMQCMNRIGAVNGFGNYAVDKAVLRDEWNFKGELVTDSYSSGLVRENLAQRMGGDLPLGTWPVAVAGDWNASKNMVTYNGADSPTQWSAIRTSAQHVLYAAANSMLTYNGYNIAAFTTQNVYAGLSEKKLRYALGQEVNINLGVSADVIGTDKIVYSATGLPAGLSINAQTGVITGTVNEEVTATVKVTMKVTNAGEEWISGTVSMVMVFEEGENAGGCAGGCASIGTSVETIIGSFILVGGMIFAAHCVRSKKETAKG